MEFFRIRRDIPFMRHALVFNLISLVTFLAAVFFLFTRGLNFSIEFTGGTVMEVSYAEDANPDKIRDALGGIGLKDVSVQSFGTSKDILIRLPLKIVEGKSQITNLFYRVGGSPTGEAGTLTLRAARDVNLNASISDGFFQTEDRLNPAYIKQVDNWVARVTANGATPIATNVGGPLHQLNLVGRFVQPHLAGDDRRVLNGMRWICRL